MLRPRCIGNDIESQQMTALFLSSPLMIMVPCSPSSSRSFYIIFFFHEQNQQCHFQGLASVHRFAQERSRAKHHQFRSSPCNFLAIDPPSASTATVWEMSIVDYLIHHQHIVASVPRCRSERHPTKLPSLKLT